jgi:hypothetical protein
MFPVREHPSRHICAYGLSLEGHTFYDPDVALTGMHDLDLSLVLQILLLRSTQRICYETKAH